MIQWTFKIQVMEETEYSDLRPLFPPLFHVICLIYSNSNYYSSQARIIVILKVEFSALCFFSVDFIYCFKETCNLIIDYTKTYLDPSTIFQVEVKSTYLILCSHLFVFYCFFLSLMLIFRWRKPWINWRFHSKPWKSLRKELLNILQHKFNDQIKWCHEQIRHIQYIKTTSIVNHIFGSF